jgi:hypothetical protein
MVALGVETTKAGLGDHWDDVDRWVRNMLVEGQLTRGEWVYRMAADLPASPVDETSESADRAVERSIGGFAGFGRVNEFVSGHQGRIVPGLGIMHCCTGNGARALYYAWDNIVHHQDGRLRVNLLLNRASPWADVDSYIPYTGRVDVKVKQPVNLALRIPEWSKPDEVQVAVNAEARRVSWEGRYAQVGDVRPGEVATMTFPLPRRTDTIFIEKERYHLLRKGNDVIEVDPPGRYGPLYQRAHYHADSTRWRQMERFVSNEQLHW